VYRKKELETKVKTTAQEQFADHHLSMPSTSSERRFDAMATDCGSTGSLQILLLARLDANSGLFDLHLLPGIRTATTLPLKCDDARLFSGVRFAEASEFLSATKSPCRLEKGAGLGERQQFDVLAVDAFSSDAIPAHLLTNQAVNDYQQAVLAQAQSEGQRGSGGKNSFSRWRNCSKVSDKADIFGDVSYLFWGGVQCSLPCLDVGKRVLARDTLKEFSTQKFLSR
jgi:hypothetical protein